MQFGQRRGESKIEVVRREFPATAVLKILVAAMRCCDTFPFMSRFPRFTLFFALTAALMFAPCVGRAVEAESAPRVASEYFLASDAIDLKQVLPVPPAPESLAAAADMEVVRQVEVWRTPEQVALAKFIENDNAFNHASVLGAWFTAANLPVTAQFLKEVTADANLVSRGTKKLFQRLRPPQVDPTLRPCVEVPASAGYPSGHAMRATLWAAVLSDIFPEQKAALEARAQNARWSRVIGGVHFPSDVIGGRLLAEAIMRELRKNPAYEAKVKKCRAEAEPHLLKKAA